MAVFSQAEVYESSRKSSRELYSAVDAKIGSLLDRAAQDALLAEVIRDNNLQKTTHTSQVQHTPATLRQHLENQTRNKKTGTQIGEFWRLGSSMFKEKHLSTIGLLPEAAVVAATSHSTTHHSGGQALGREQLAIVGAGDLSSGPGAGAKRNRSAAHLDGALQPSPKRMTIKIGSAMNTGSAGGQERLRDPGNMPETSHEKRPSSERDPIMTDNADIATSTQAPMPSIMHLTGHDQEHIPQNNGQSRQAVGGEKDEAFSRRAKGTTVCAGMQQGQRETANVSEPNDEVENFALTSDANVGGGAEIPESDDGDEETLQQQIRRGPRVPEIGDIQEGRIKAPLKNIREQHAERLVTNRAQSDRATRDLYPPEIPEARNNRMSKTQRLQNEALAGLKDAMNSMYVEAGNFLVDYCASNNLDFTVCAEFVKDPDLELEALYHKALGGKQWATTLMERCNQEKPWRQGAKDLAASLVAADVLQVVFQSEQPWDLQNQIKSAVGIRLKYYEEAMYDRGYQLDEFLKQSTFKMMDDPHFQDTEVAGHARRLAARFAMTIAPHLALFRRKQRPAEGRPENAPGTNPDWVTSLAHLYKTALVFKGKIESYHEHQFDYTWPESGTLIDGEAVLPAHGNTGFEQRLQLVLWPGIRMTKVPALGGPVKVCFAAPARAKTTDQL